MAVVTKMCYYSIAPTFTLFYFYFSMYDLGKSKVKDVVAKKTISALNAVTDETNPEAEIANVYERIDQIRKPTKDHRDYR